MDDKDCPNRSQLQTNKEKHDMRVDDKGPTNTMGLTIHTTAEKPHQDSNSPQYHKMENTSALKVYSRNGGCRKQEASIKAKVKASKSNHDDDSDKSEEHDMKVKSYCQAVLHYCRILKLNLSML